MRASALFGAVGIGFGMWLLLAASIWHGITPILEILP